MALKVLVVGSGGREHAVVWKLKQSPHVGQIFVAPGNAGTAELAKNVPLAPTDIHGICAFACQAQLDFVVVTPDDPLALGLCDLLQAAKIPCFGPKAKAARIEASKSFAKEIMRERKVPTAAASVFTDFEAATAYCRAFAGKLVIKADGLALGKGVLISEHLDEQLAFLRELMQEKRFAQAGEKVLIEEFLTGRELSLLCFTDGKDIALLPNARDHKRIFAGDLGPNTGGMGAYSPGEIFTPSQERELVEQIFEPVLAGLAARDSAFSGVLYAGLILTASGAKVIEFNARLGDPETQALLPLLDSDLFEIFQAIEQHRLGEIKLVWRSQASCALVLASAGYPGPYKGDQNIRFLSDLAGVYCFHAGTKRNAEGELQTAGGRVMALTAVADTYTQAAQIAYKAAEQVDFAGKYYRKDIGLTGAGEA